MKREILNIVIWHKKYIFPYLNILGYVMKSDGMKSFFTKLLLNSRSFPLSEFYFRLGENKVQGQNVVHKNVS